MANKAYVIKVYPAKKSSPRLNRGQLGDLAQEVVAGVFDTCGYKTEQVAIHVESEEPFATDLDLAALNPQEGDIFSFTLHPGNTRDTALTAEWLKQQTPENTIIVGGTGMDTIVAKTILEDFPAINYALIGLAELNLPLLLEGMKNGNFDQVPGLCYMHEGKFVAVTNRSYAKWKEGAL